MPLRTIDFFFALLLFLHSGASVAWEERFVEQAWVRDATGPVISIGQPGEFDDTHLFAPCVIHDGSRFLMWYPGSRGEVSQRIFRLGFATSTDGVHFTKQGPVVEFGDGATSILTPTVMRENGVFRMWFSGADLTRTDAPHRLYQMSSPDGAEWSPPSEPQLDNIYAPTILRDGNIYHLWYTDPSSDPWCFRYATSKDGKTWEPHPDPVMVVDQEWEKGRLFYPTVLKLGDRFAMWYGSYWSARPNTTALGFATSRDGIAWRKNPNNPVFRPDESHAWESHYTTSQSIVRLPDGSLRMWYASREAPPFVHKYFALGTAILPPPTRQAWKERAPELRQAMREILTLPEPGEPIDARTHRNIDADKSTIEAVSFHSEPESRVTASLYLPKQGTPPYPAVIVACGHGGSKSGLYAQYAGQLYASFGMACLVPDTIGEEEREKDGRLGARGHDLYALGEGNPEFVRTQLKRSVLGKITWDLMRGVDYLTTREEIDPEKIGLVGYSLGGASGGCAAILDDRIRAAVITGWAFSARYASYGKHCSRLPYAEFDAIMGFDEMTALLAPHCATLFYCGDRDLVVDRTELGKAVVRDLKETTVGAKQILAEAGMPRRIEYKIDPGADHRPLFLAPAGVAWLLEHLNGGKEHPGLAKTVRFGDWVESQGARIEKLYDTEERERGLLAVDVGAVYRRPADLACFPDLQPSAEYTMEGWVASRLRD